MDEHIGTIGNHREGPTGTHLLAQSAVCPQTRGTHRQAGSVVALQENGIAVDDTVEEQRPAGGGSMAAVVGR